MQEKKSSAKPNPLDMRELELPETVFIRDVENRVFQGIVLQSLSKISGIALLEGNFIDSIFNRGSTEGVKGIFAEQDNKHQSVSIKIEVNIRYGEQIPQKADEIQTKVAEDITRLTGLHVSCVHVVFKDVISENDAARINHAANDEALKISEASVEEEYSEEF